MKKLEIKAGDRYGRLTIIREVEPQILPSGQIKRMVECLCDCGKVKTTSLAHMREGETISCGCFGIEINHLHSRIHGESSGGKMTTECHTYHSMKQRCYNPKNNRYKYYGGRGIRVCDRWLGKNGLQNFLADMGRRPSSDHSIDRINNNGNYEPSNCRWATIIEQRHNQSNFKTKNKSKEIA